MSPLNLQQFKYVPLESVPVLRPVDRIEYIKQRCRGRRVLDVGAYDETEVDKPQHKSWRWLHAEIASVAQEVLGVDGSPKLKETRGIETRCGTRIVYGTVEELDNVLLSFRPDLVVAGELIEHTANTLAWLTRLGEVAPGTRVLLTTPNATSILNIGLAFLKRENTPRDHLQIYSFKSLTTLARKLEMTEVEIHPYYYDPHMFRGKVSKALVPLIYAIDYLILIPVQFLFPLTAGGMIIEGVVGQGTLTPPRQTSAVSEPKAIAP